MVESNDPALRNTISLVKSAQQGSRKALEDLFCRYLPRVRQIVALRLGYRQRLFVEVEDIVQDTLLKVFEGLHRFEQRSEGSFRNWLARCVECQIVDSAREMGAKKRGAGGAKRFADIRGETLTSSVFPAEGPTPSKVAQGKEAQEKLEEALLGLPQHYREVIVLRQLCEMSYPEIAKTMGFNEEASARKACSRALQKLREALGE